MTVTMKNRFLIYLSFFASMFLIYGYTKNDPKQLRNLTPLILFSIAYGSAMGSIGTPSGGGRNVIMLDY